MCKLCEDKSVWLYVKDSCFHDFAFVQGPTQKLYKTIFVEVITVIFNIINNNVMINTKNSETYSWRRQVSRFVRREGRELGALSTHR